MAHPYPDEQRRRRRNPPVQKKNTPLLFKALSWVGVILLCFVLGYLGANWLMELLNRRLLLKPDNVVANQEELDALNAKTPPPTPAKGNVQQVSLRLFYVKGNAIAEAGRSFVARTQEDNIKDAVEAILNLSGVKANLRHIFRNADTVYLDFSSPLASAISSMGQRQSLLLLTGLVRTMQTNFSPIEQVRFLIDSRAPASGGPVDLSLPWKMPSRS